MKIFVRSLIALILALGIWLIWLLWPTSTPAIVDVNGIIISGSITEEVSGYIGTGQISDMAANETYSYTYALAEAERRGNEDAIAELMHIGAPPYGVDETIVQRGWLTEFGGGLTRDGQ